MKTIGLLGGMSWESTELYYRKINEGVRNLRGGLHSAKIVMYSVDFHEIEELQHHAEWDRAGEILGQAARRLELAGADFLLICTNTMHKCFLSIEKYIKIPILHIADATAKQIKKQGIITVGLLGTNFTMEQDFYKGRLAANHGLNVIIPNETDRQIVHRAIYDELCLGVVRDESRQEYLRIMGQMQDQGAEAVIEGCTEIVMLVNQEHTSIPLFDTTAIHAEAAVEMACAQNESSADPL